MTEDDRQRCAVTAALLRQSRGIAWLVRGITVTAALVLLVAQAMWVPMPGAGAISTIALLVLGGLGEWLALRVGFDAALFAQLAESGDAQALLRMDDALLSLTLMPSTKAGRAVDLRCAGALRLLRWQGRVLVLQCALLILGTLLTTLQGHP